MHTFQNCHHTIDIPSPPSPPPVTETPLPESPPASSQKYSTPVKQLEEILETRDKEQRGEAPVLNGVCIYV